MLLGRHHELRTISALVDGIAAPATAPSPFVLSISGEAGSGRSALLDEARALAADAGAAVLAARGSSDDGEAPFVGLLTLLRPLERDLDALAGDRVDPLRSALALRRDRVDPLDVRLALLRVLTNAADRQPVAVLLDDADQLDLATLDALRFALGRLGVDRVGAVVVSSSAVGPLDGVATHRLPLAPLGADVLATIVQERTRCAPDVARRCAELADGNPLTAIELAGSLTDDERAGTAPMPPVPRTTIRVVERLQAELDALPDPARRAVVVVAADRSGSLPVVLSALAALGEPPEGLDAAEHAGVVEVDGHSVRFRHPLLRPLAYRLVAARSRRAAHRAIATALVEPHQAAERTWQLVASCAGPDDEVAALLDLVAAEALHRGALAEAAATIERAARLSSDPQARAARLRRAAVAHLDALALDEAIRLADEAAHAGDLDADLLVVEALERGAGSTAALARLATIAERADGVIDAAILGIVRADLLLSAERAADATAALREAGPVTDADADALRAALVASFEPGAPLPNEPPRGDGAIARRARRRSLAAAAGRGDGPDAPTTVDELLAAARAASVHGRTDEARALCEQASAMVPPGCDALAAQAERLRAALDDAEAEDDVLAMLTPAERRVAKAVASGRTNREVADHLYLSVKTVDFHLQAVYRKLGVRSRTELALRLTSTTTGDRR